MRQSLKARAMSCAAVSLDGFECGGHSGKGDDANFILMRHAADDSKIPFIAKDGISHGCSLAVTPALSAEGINMSARFIAVNEVADLM